MILRNFVIYTVPKRSNSEIETRSFGQAESTWAVSVTGLLGIGRFGLEIFWSDYEILQKSYLQTFYCKRTWINEKFYFKKMQTWSKIQKFININTWFSC